MIVMTTLCTCTTFHDGLDDVIEIIDDTIDTEHVSMGLFSPSSIIVIFKLHNNTRVKIHKAIIKQYSHPRKI